MEPYVPAFEKLGFVPKRVGPNLPTMAPNSLYPSADGAWVLTAANSNIIFGRLAPVMQQPELLTDPRFATLRARGHRQNMAARDRPEERRVGQEVVRPGRSRWSRIH